jgi:hypothetical protein
MVLQRADHGTHSPSDVDRKVQFSSSRSGLSGVLGYIVGFLVFGLNLERAFPERANFPIAS